MIFLYIFLIILALLIFVLFLNVHIIFVYRETAQVWLRILFFKKDAFQLFKRFTSADNSVDKKSKEKPNDVNSPNKKNNKNGGSLLGFAEFLVRITKVITFAIKRHFAKMKINLKEFYLTIGTDDAAKTAIVYGGVIQTANILCELLRRFSNFRCDNRHLFIAPDFSSEKSRCSIHLDLSFKPIHLIWILILSYMKLFESEDVSHV